MTTVAEIATAAPARVLVVDDTVIYRRVISDALQEIPGVEVIATATNGRIALEKIRDLKPDIVTLDLEMPELNGVEVLKELRARGDTTPVVMLSAFTSSSARATTEALALGAFDFVLKPESEQPHLSAAQLREKLRPRIEAILAKRGRKLPAPRPVEESRKPASVVRAMPRLPGEIQMVVIGISTGGPNALTQMMPKLPGDLGAPVLIVQHMPPLFTHSLAEDLNRRCALEVREAQDGDLIESGTALIAPGGRQMKFEERDGLRYIKLTDDPPECACRPSADYLFRAAAHIVGHSVLAVIMTGMGTDGTIGIRLLKRKGASVIAQNKETCVVFGMPSTPVAEGLVDEVLPLDEIAAHITARVGRRRFV
jgi:two-component system chemotaxis response regulator CheB